MIVFKDVITSHELFTDTYKIKVTENGMFYEVEGKRITTKEEFNEASIGANPSIVEETEGTAESSISGVDIVLNNRLEAVAISKGHFKERIKVYMGVIKVHLLEKNPERLAGFLTDAPRAVKKILKNFDNYEFYTGDLLNQDGMLAMLDYRDDGITPFMLFFKDGLEAEKC